MKALLSCFSRGNNNKESNRLRKDHSKAGNDSSGQDQHQHVQEHDPNENEHMRISNTSSKRGKTDTSIDVKIKRKNMKMKRASVFMGANAISILCKEGKLDPTKPITIKYSVSFIHLPH